MDRHRSDGCCWQHGILFSHVFQVAFSVSKNPFEHVPHVGHLENIGGLQHKVTTICMMNRTGLNHGEVGQIHTVLHIFFDFPEQVVICRVVFDNDGCAFLFAVVDE